jgi:hypothetical protein
METQPTPKRRGFGREFKTSAVERMDTGSADASL